MIIAKVKNILVFSNRTLITTSIEFKSIHQLHLKILQTQMLQLFYIEMILSFSQLSQYWYKNCGNCEIVLWCATVFYRCHNLVVRSESMIVENWIKLTLKGRNIFQKNCDICDWSLRLLWLIKIATIVNIEGTRLFLGSAVTECIIFMLVIGSLSLSPHFLQNLCFKFI